MARRLVLIMAAGALVAASAAPAGADEPAPPREEEVIEPAREGLVIDSVAFGDGGGGPVPAGEETTVRVTLVNPTETDYTGVAVTLEPENEGIRVTRGHAEIGTIPAGGDAGAAFAFVVPETACEGFAVFMLHFSSSPDQPPLGFETEVACPGPRLFIANLRYSGGDGDWAAEAGERLEVHLSLANGGRDPATDVRGVLRAASTGVTVIDGSASWGSIPADGQAEGDAFVIEVAADAPGWQGCGPLPGEERPVEDQTVEGQAVEGQAVEGEPEPLSPSPVEPDPATTGEGPAEDAHPAAFAMTLEITAGGGYTDTLHLDSAYGQIVCIASDGPATGAIGLPGDAAEDAARELAAEPAAASRGAAVPVAASLAVIVLATLLARRPWEQIRR